MSNYKVLKRHRARIAAQLAQITPILAHRGHGSDPRFYDTLSYEPAPPAYSSHIQSLAAQKSWRLGEIRQLILSEFTCGYDFSCGHAHTFRAAQGDAPGGRGAPADYRNKIICAYFRDRDYPGCLEAIGARPEITEYEIINKIYVKCLYAAGRFYDCQAMITECYCPEELEDPQEKIFYYLQRAMSVAATGAFTRALGDLSAAAGEPPASLAMENQTPAILWLQAQYNQFLGRPEKTYRALRALEKENRAARWGAARPLTPRGEGYLAEYKKIISSGSK